MGVTLGLFFLVLAIVLFFVAGVFTTQPRDHIHLGWLGAFALALSFLF